MQTENLTRYTERVRVGELLRHDGKPYSGDAVIRYAWGWPKSASTLAAHAIQDRQGDRRFLVELLEPDITRQQDQVIRDRPEILPALMRGLHGRGTREHKRHDRPLRGIILTLDGWQDDAGLSTEVLRAAAIRFGSNLDEIASATEFTTADDHLRMTVMLDEVGP